jgi:hypothetical protein
MTHAIRNRGASTRAALAPVTLIAVCLLACEAAAEEPVSEWTAPVSVSQQPDTFSDVPVLLCDPYQNIHAFWVERIGQGAAIFTRNDVGGAWSNPARVLATPAGYPAHLAAVIAAGEAVHLLWTSAVRGALMYTRAPLSRAADPAAWKEPTVLARDVDSGSLTADSTGVLHVIYGTSDFEARVHTVAYVRSTDDGQTWSEPRTALALNTPVASTAVTPAIAVDGTGRVHVTWEVRSYEYGAYSRIGYVRSTDHGGSWSAPLELGASETRPGVAIPAVFAFGDDEIHLTYDVPDRLHQWSSDGGATWSTPTRILSLGAAFGGANQLTKDSAGALHVVAAVNNGVYHATWDGETWSSADAIDRRDIDPHHQQIVACRGNQLHVVYDDRTGVHEIWYSTRRVNAPPMAQRPVPPSGALNETPEAAYPMLPRIILFGAMAVLLAGTLLVLRLSRRR